MKKTIVFIAFIAISISLKAQIKPDVVNSLGGSTSYTGGYLAYAVGEPIIGTATDGNTTITQGYLQTWLSIAKRVTINVFLQGLFNIETNRMNEAKDGNLDLPQWGANIADKINISLHNETPPYDLVYEFPAVDLSTSGQAYITVPANHNGNYYIAIKNRNHLETWSSLAIPFNESIIQFDFTSAMTQAYGINAQKEVSTNIYAIYLGDLDQSGWVDSEDFNIFEPILSLGPIGFYTPDFNGSGWVDSEDFNLFEPQLSLGVYTQTP